MRVIGTALIGALVACGGNDDFEPRLRPATEEECPFGTGGGVVLEREYERKDVVCYNETAEPEPEAVTCNSIQDDIIAALQAHVDSGVVAVDTEPCGPNGIANGVVEFGEGIPESSQQNLIQQYAAACELADETCDS